ncbi:hypothetical protein [uncultured Psychrobacter sp.]|uniref:hypothetical protein n=1 Tax=uncultured Psychrobacter sp. TaxID=259303 RepID=UPI00345AA991
MKLKLPILLISASFLFACSSADETSDYETSSTPTYEASASETYSVEKQSYVQSCIDTSDESFCSCQFDVMDPILSSSIGNDWSMKTMEEKDFGTYVSAVETAVSQCS